MSTKSVLIAAVAGVAAVAGLGALFRLRAAGASTTRARMRC